MKNSDYLKTFRLYIGLKQHFNPDNNFVYKSHENFKKLNVDSLLKRKDRDYFVGLTRKINPDQYEYILSMFIKNRDMWVGEMLERNNREFHSKRMGIINNLEDIVISELDELLLINEDNLLTMTKHNGNIPHIVKNKSISIETLAVLNKIYNFTSESTINPLWNERRHHINSYSKLLYVNPTIEDYVKELLLCN